MTSHSAQIRLGENALADETARVLCQERFRELVDRHSRFVFRLAYAALRNSYDAEDVAQEVFLSAYRSSQWERLDDERAYLSRITWRHAVARLKKLRSLKLSPNGVPGETASTLPTPEESALQSNWSAVVRHMIGTLPDDLRLPLALTTAGDLTSAEIAALLGIPEGTVRTRAMKARQILKQKLSALKGGSNGC